jgi:hypothetical protein
VTEVVDKVCDVILGIQTIFDSENIVEVVIDILTGIPTV